MSENLYHLEVENFLPECQQTDPRYTKLEFASTNELEVQQASGVFDTLSNLPLYSLDADDKLSTEYFLWTRPAIPWGNQCSYDQMKEAADAAKVVDT